MLFTELPPEAQERELADINVRWGQLYRLVKDVSDQVIKYLLLTNSGGAVAVLSFLGASQEVRELQAPKIALALFAVGVIMSGVLLALRLHQFEWLDKQFRVDVTAYLNGKLERAELYAHDQARTESRMFRINYIVGYLSFGCFIGGGLIGLFSIFSV